MLLTVSHMSFGHFYFLFPQQQHQQQKYYFTEIQHVCVCVIILVNDKRKIVYSLLLLRLLLSYCLYARQQSLNRNDRQLLNLGNGRWVCFPQRLKYGYDTCVNKLKGANVGVSYIYGICWTEYWRGKLDVYSIYNLQSSSKYVHFSISCRKIFYGFI